MRGLPFIHQMPSMTNIDAVDTATVGSALPSCPFAGTMLLTALGAVGAFVLHPERRFAATASVAPPPSEGHSPPMLTQAPQG